MSISILKKVVGAVLFYSGIFYLHSFIRKIIGKNEFIVLMYHSVGRNKQDGFDSNVISSSEVNFEKQVKYLSERYNVITFDKLLYYCKNERELPPNTAIITFDDGYKDNYEVAYQILKKYNLPATISLTTGHIGNDELFWWDKVVYLINKSNSEYVRIEGLGAFLVKDKIKATKEIQQRFKDLPEDRKNYLIEELAKTLKLRIPKEKGLFLSWDEAREMSRNNISFASHSVTHPILTRISFEQAKDEIMNSKKKIEREINKKVLVFTYPNGRVQDMSEEIDNFLKQNGFRFALTTKYGLNEFKPDMFRIKRLHIQYDDDLRLFKIKLSGLGNLLEPIYSKYFT